MLKAVRKLVLGERDCCSRFTALSTGTPDKWTGTSTENIKARSDHASPWFYADQSEAWLDYSSGAGGAGGGGK